MSTCQRALVFRGLVAAACGIGGTALAQAADPVIAYVGQAGSEAGKLVVMNADGSNAAAVLTPPAGSALDHPTWSPSGAQLAVFVSNQGLWRLDVAVLNGKPKGLNPTPLVPALPAPGVHAGNDPAWSPAGDQIAFYTYTADFTYSIQTVPAGGGTPTTRYSAPLFLFAPAWSPEASRIAFLEHDPAYASAVRIRVLDLSTGIASTALSGDFFAQFARGSGGGYRGLDWARSGEVLAFSVGSTDSATRPSERRPDTAVYLLDLTGGVPVLGVDPGVQPTWSPDGGSIVYRDIENGRLRRIDLGTGLITTFGNKSGVKPAWRRY